MAVENKYVDADLVAGKKGNAINLVAADGFSGIATFETAAADDNDSVYRLFKNVDPNLIPVRLALANDAIAGFTDANVGLYQPLEAGGVVVDDNCLADALDFSSAHSRILALDGLAAVDLADAKKTLWQLAGETLNNHKPSYDICITAIAAASAVGTVTAYAFFVQG